MPRTPTHPQSKQPLPSSTSTQQVEIHHATFDRKRTTLQQKKNAIESEQKRIEVEEKKLDAAKRDVELQKNRLAAERAREELRLLEDIFERALRSMLRLANDYLDRGETERVVKSIETRVRCTVNDLNVERTLGVKRLKVDDRAQCCANDARMSAVKIEQKVEVPSGVKVEKNTERTVPQKRSATCAGFRQAYVESEDDAEEGC